MANGPDEWLPPVTSVCFLRPRRISRTRGLFRASCEGVRSASRSSLKASSNGSAEAQGAGAVDAVGHLAFWRHVVREYGYAQGWHEVHERREGGAIAELPLAH